jgi:hypothetical protein
VITKGRVIFGAIFDERRSKGARWITIFGSLGLKTVKIKAMVTIERMMKNIEDIPKQTLRFFLAMVLVFGYGVD